MIRVSSRARRHEDRAGDPLDGLVNLFDVGIVLAVAFLLAALSARHLSLSASPADQSTPSNAVVVSPGQSLHPLPTSGASTVGTGTPIGRVYRLQDGQLVYVVPATATAGTPQPTPSR